MSYLLSLVVLTFSVRLWLSPVSYRRCEQWMKSNVRKLKRPKEFDYQSAWINFLLVVRGEMTAGLPPEVAISNAIEFQPIKFLPAVQKAISEQSSISGALAKEVETSSSIETRKLYAALVMSQVSGAPLVPSLDELIETSMSRAQQHELIRAELSSTRATIFVLASLPVLGVAISTLLGTNALGWLFATPGGWICLGLAGVLEGVGLWWTRMLIQRVTVM